MIAYIDSWLSAWAEWSLTSKEARGYASHSAEYRMMTENAATTSKKHHRQKKRMVEFSDSTGTKRYTIRHTEPMRCIEKSGKKIVKTVDNPVCEAMDSAIGYLRYQRPLFRDAMLLKYCSGFNTDTCAALMKMSRGSFIALTNNAHEVLDTYLYMHYSELVEKVSRLTQDAAKTKTIEASENEPAKPIDRFDTNNAKLTDEEVNRLEAVLVAMSRIDQRDVITLTTV